MRKSCFDCVRKHLGSAGIFIKETHLGYPDYDIWAIGELDHASDECLEKNPELAAVIREHRLAWMSNSNHRIPIEEINAYIKCCELADSSGIPHPAVPDNVIDGLAKNENGIVFHGDTRP